jgi:hypothetical protein
MRKKHLDGKCLVQLHCIHSFIHSLLTEYTFQHTIQFSQLATNHTKNKITLPAWPQLVTSRTVDCTLIKTYRLVFQNICLIAL